MRYHQIFTLFLILLMLGVSLSCKRDKCKRVTCVNGACIDGTCNCTEGYYTPDCSAIINAGLDGNWSVEELCTAGADAYNVVLAAPSTSMVQIQFTGLWGRPVAVTADLGSDGTTVQISRQPLGNVDIDAEGTINSARTQITLHYNVFQSGASQAFDICTATLSQN